MSLRFKLPLFTTLFVLLASITLLGISIHQHVEKRTRDINTLLDLREKGSDINTLVDSRIDQIRSDSHTIIRERIVYSLVLLFVCALAIFLLSRLIIGPLNRLVALSGEIASGEKSFAERITLRSDDEIGRLTGSFNTLLEHIELSIATARQTAEQYRELIENANSAIIRLDGRGIVLFFNEYAQKLFGYAPEQVIGIPVTETIGKPLDPDMPEKTIIELMTHGTYGELEHRTSSGRYLWIAWTIRPMADERGIVTEYLCVGSDISERKKAEKFAALERRRLIQTDKMATLGILAAGIAHEINNPNNFIILNSQNLSELWKDIAPVLDRYTHDRPDFSLAGIPYTEMKTDIPFLLQGITDGARRIKHIVDSLKDFARQDSGDFREHVEVIKVIEAARLIAGTMIKKATAHFSVEVRGEIPALRGNFQRLEQVLINLIANACEATVDPEKPIVITVDYQASSRSILIAVIDRGTGISPENMKNIVSPFYTTKRDSGGTGLGLAIAYSIIKDHGGELKFSSVIGKGTTATIMLPTS
ncbi:MAG: PAS domain S-box protein [Chitinispirillaceae bacterium]|nr:PAS domain S-box protein [Chitinispirillaceae bacterium]